MFQGMVSDLELKIMHLVKNLLISWDLGLLKTLTNP